jgi:hypothetical protein
MNDKNKIDPNQVTEFATPSSMNLSVIDGGFDENEKLFNRIICEPQTFSLDEFKILIDERFRSRLNFNVIESLSYTRIQYLVRDTLERDLILAIMDGNDAETNRLQGVIERRNQLGIRVVSELNERSSANEAAL